MSENTAAAVAPAATATPAAAAGMRSEIIAKWSKFNDAEVAALKSKDELIAGVQSKYSIDQAQARKDVDSFAKGRAL